ncbi:hypothetical protein M422DRAFT_194507 [Sphaerobolus stellatus SS14]|uniref:DyP dimeric alpha+beta barrel domain-containing protein n=1 Tax=Sphaerobolus stellatus (strain SS14) TaxID=990650 RepID=A0A0C9UHC0_SPHS4|nr:hypothetical protein M422DRAFT_194507 [Sphaerobolus stellatus SS14]
MGFYHFLNDFHFSGGQFREAAELGDPGTDQWVGTFRGKKVHGVFLLASDSTTVIDAEWAAVNQLFGSSITELYTLSAEARPGDQAGHEHFGFLDGISQPAINGFTANPAPGQSIVAPGRVLLGRDGDERMLGRPSWAKDGSFLVFRQLKQLVPEFNKFLRDNPLLLPGLTPEQGSELLGARMVGRWKSGAPVDLAPVFDDPTLAQDPMRNNNFDFSYPGEDLASNQTRCPFSAHIRKTAPRADFRSGNPEHHIVRAGIPYDPEGIGF